MVKSPFAIFMHHAIREDHNLLSRETHNTTIHSVPLCRVHTNKAIHVRCIKLAHNEANISPSTQVIDFLWCYVHQANPCLKTKLGSLLTHSLSCTFQKIWNTNFKSRFLAKFSNCWFPPCPSRG